MRRETIYSEDPVAVALQWEQLGAPLLHVVDLNGAIEGRPAYVLEDNRGQPRYYLLAQPGLNLDMFVNRPVEVFGPMVQRPDLAGGGYIAVNRLHLLR